MLLTYSMDFFINRIWDLEYLKALVYFFWTTAQQFSALFEAQFPLSEVSSLLYFKCVIVNETASGNVVTDY